MEADISIWRKTGHFYFALTRRHESARFVASIFKFIQTGLLQMLR